MPKIGTLRSTHKSLSARRAWIEIQHMSHDFPAPKVALRKESVDRNVNSHSSTRRKVIVALRKESVDRNRDAGNCTTAETASLSARRAWIEMRKITITVDDVTVALRKESVDRNSTYDTRLPRAQVSLSARRAWIEMTCGGGRNEQPRCRSPQGERG